MSNQNSSSEIEKTLKAMEEAKLRNKQVFIEKNWENQNPTENKPVAVQEEAAQLKANPEKNTGKSKNLTSWGYVKRFLIMLLGGWLGLHVLLGFMQREILYFGSNNPAGNPEKYGFAKGNVDEFNLVVKSENGVRLAGWHVLPQGSTIEMWNRDLKNFNNSPAAEGEKFLNETAIIYFPGNAGHRGYRSATLNDLASLNSHVFIVDYRGYSDSTGSPTEKNLVMDSIQLYDYVLSMGFNPRRVILFGESLGGGVATQLAAEISRNKKQLGGMIIQSSFDSLENIAQLHYRFLFVKLLLCDKYLSNKYMPDIKCALLSIHGEQDSIVPMVNGKRLFDAAPAKSELGVIKEFYGIPLCGHNDVREVGGAELKAKINEFIRKVEQVAKSKR